MRLDPTAPGPTTGEVRKNLDKPLHAKSLAQGLSSFLPAGALWLLTMLGIVLLPWWAKVPLGVLNGMAIGVFFIVGHDAGHGILFPRRWMNRLVGRVCLMPALHPFAAWVHNHNGLHHGFTNIKEKDPGFPPLSLTEYQSLSGWRKFLYRISRTWYGLAALYFCEMWIRWEILPTGNRRPRNLRAYQIDRAVVLLFMAVWIGGLVAVALLNGEGWLGVLGMVAVGFLLPQFIWNWFIAFIIYQQHIHPRVPWYSELDKPMPSYFQAQVRATPHLYFPKPYRFLLRNIMEHTAHHVDPGVPLYHLPEAQQKIEKAYRREIVRVLWTPGNFRRMLKTCRLYDYAAHRWLDYDGTPTTPVLISKDIERG